MTPHLLHSAPSLTPQEYWWRERVCTEQIIHVNGICRIARRTWVSFLGLQLVLAIIVFGVDHKSLLLETAIQVPLLYSSLPQRTFFIVAPLALLCMQYWVVLQQIQTADSLWRLEREINRLEGSGLPDIHRLRLQLDSFYLAQRLIGHSRDSPATVAAAWIGNAITRVTPLIVILLFQVAYLAQHDVLTTWLHRVVALSSIALIGYHKHKTWYPREPLVASWMRSARNTPMRTGFGIVGLLFLTFFTVAVATIPDEMMDQVASTVGPAAPNQSAAYPAPSRRVFWLTKLLFEGPIDGRSGRRTSLFSRNLVVVDATISAMPLAPSEAGLSLRGRDLRYATFDRSRMHGVDLTGAKLRSASFNHAILTGARFESVDAQLTKFIGTNMSNAQIVLADFSGSVFSGTRFEGIRYLCAQPPVCGFHQATLQNVVGMPTELVDAIRKVVAQKNQN